MLCGFGIVKYILFPFQCIIERILGFLDTQKKLLKNLQLAFQAYRIMIAWSQKEEKNPYECLMNRWYESFVSLDIVAFSLFSDIFFWIFSTFFRPFPASIDSFHSISYFSQLYTCIYTFLFHLLFIWFQIAIRLTAGNSLSRWFSISRFLPWTEFDN